MEHTDPHQIPDDETLRESPSPAAALLPKPPGWPYMTYPEAVLMSVVFLVLQILIGAFIGILIVIGGLVFGVSPEQNLALSNPAAFMVANLWAVLPLFVWGWFRSGQTVREAFALRAFPWTVLPALVFMGIGAALLMSELDNLTRRLIPLPTLFPEVFDSLFSSPVLGFFIVVIMAPLTEEPLFRGIILRGLRRQHGTGGSCIVSALLFALIHLNPPQLLPAFLLGLLLAGIQLRTGSLWPCVWLHAVINFVPLGAFGLFPDQLPGLTTPPEAGLFHPLWLDALALTLFLAGVVSFCAATRSRPSSAARPESQDS